MLQQLIPPLYLELNEYFKDESCLLYVWVPNSSQIHRLNNSKILDRIEDADIDITNNTVAVQNAYNRKQQEYTENKIYEFVELSDLRMDLIAKVRKAATLQNGNHEFQDMNDLEILKSLQMYKKDFVSGRQGFTLSSILVFGKDETIMSVLPYFRVDALLRERDEERYDDRVDIQTNLIETYTNLMDFIQKHFSDKFMLEKDQRINVRDVLFRELIVNMLIHREYSNAYVSRIEIYRQKVIVKNANKPIHTGVITEPIIEPYPKNPTIAKVFKILGRIDELGSGIKKIFKYSDWYFESVPNIKNEEIFSVDIPRNDIEMPRDLDSKKISTEEQQVLTFITENGKIKTGEARILLNRSYKYARELLNEMAGKSLIEWVRKSSTDPTQYYK